MPRLRRLSWGRGVARSFPFVRGARFGSCSFEDVHVGSNLLSFIALMCGGHPMIGNSLLREGIGPFLRWAFVFGF